MKMFAKRSQTIWQTLALAVVATWALGPQVAAEGTFGGGDTIGSHPNTQGDGDEGELETRPVFYLEGPRLVLLDGTPPFEINGPGQAIGVETGDPDIVRFEFTAEASVTIPMNRLVDPRVSVGFQVAPRGGATRVRWDLGSHSSRFQTLPIDTDVELPVTRLRRAGVLEQGLGFTGFHRTSGRTRYSISTGSCALIVQPE